MKIFYKSGIPQKKGFEDVLKFHVNFEHIHPYQDGNGRVRRFIMLKQCVENSIDLILIDDHFSNEYKLALNKAQTQNDYTDLSKLFQSCQNLLVENLSFLNDTLEYLENNDIQINAM